MSTAIVVGAAGGIGSAICTALSESFDILTFDREDEPRPMVADHLVLANGVTGGTWDNTIMHNLTISYQWARHCLVGKSITFIGSLATQLGLPNNPAYNASKCGLLGLMRSFAVDLAPVRVNCVSPGYVEAPMTAKSFADLKRREFIAAHTLLGRWGKPEEVANVIAFLCSDKASYITGQNIMIDGGWTARGMMDE